MRAIYRHDPSVEWVDYLDALHAAIDAAGGNEAYAARLGIPLPDVWAARDQQPGRKVLEDLGIEWIEGFQRRQPR